MWQTFASLWPAKAYIVPAGMYGCQVWRSGFLREGDVFRPTLQTLHLNFFKGTLGVKCLRLTGLYYVNVRMNLCNSIGLELP